MVQEAVTEAAGWWADHRDFRIVDRISTGILTENFHVRRSVFGYESDLALRRLHRHLEGDHDLVRHFVDEIKRTVWLYHPNIPQIFELGMRDGSHYVLCDYVPGRTLRTLMQHPLDARPVPLALVLDIVTSAAAALQHAHTCRSRDGRPLHLVHHGVSPANLVVRQRDGFVLESPLPGDAVKLVDFGMAKVTMARPWHDLPAELAEHRDDMFAYLSPEACRGEAVDHRADLFALGVVMWELLIGERLYRRTTVADTLTAITDEPSRAPSSLRRELPRELDDIVLRLLAKPAGDRFQTAAELIEAIETFTAMERAVAMPAAPGGPYR